MDLLSDILFHLRLTGTLYFRTSFTPPWGIQVPSFRNVARFHFAHKGSCFVRIDGEAKPIPLGQGDLVIVTHGAAHTLYCTPETERQALTLDEMVEKSGFTGTGTLVYGDTGSHQETQLVCGHFAFDEEAFHPLIDALPPSLHIANYGETAGRWMEHTLRVIGAEAAQPGMGNDLIALKLSEIIFAQALRTYLQSAGAERPVFAGFADPRLSRALKAIHDTPAHPWTLDALADIAGMSRAAFASRFANRMDTTPLVYLTQWRMQLARERLIGTPEPIIEVAEKAGYHSEAAFGRAFKKHFGMGPATYRRTRREALSAGQPA